MTLSWGASSGATYYGLGVRDIASGTLVVNTNVSGTSYPASLSANKQYRWNVAACNATGCSSYTTVLYFQTPTAVTVPAPPTSPSPGSTSSPGPTTSSSTVTLSWGASSGATYYGLGVRDIASGTLVVNTNVSGTSYPASLSANKQYRWNVAACNAAGCSAYTTVLYFQTPTLGVAPGAFTLTSATPSCSGSSPQITVNWTASSGVATYEVYRNGSLYSPGVPSGTLSFLNTGANVTPNATYTYFIRARNATGTRDSGSLQATALTCTGGTAPGAFTLTSATPSCSGSSPRITLSWTTSSGVATYDVYRNGSLYSPGVPAGTVSFLNEGANVTPSATYTYFIRAKNATGTRDSGSLQATALTCTGGTAPGAFTLTSATPSCNGSSPEITLSWTASSGVTTYDVYRNGSLYSPGVPAGTLSFLNAGANVSLGATYTYFIRAKNATGTSDSASLQATAPSICGGGGFDLTTTASVGGNYTAGQTNVLVPVTVSRGGGSMPTGSPYVLARLYWSTNTTWDSGDTQLWESNGSTPDFPVSVLNSSGTKTVNATIAIPSAGGGTYYVIAFVDPTNFYGSETNEGNNTTVYAVTVAGMSDAGTLVAESPLDNAQKNPGEPYVKTFTLRNTGTTTWNSGYSLQYVSGEAGCSHTAQTVSGPVAPNVSYTFTIDNCTAPTTPSTYKQNWKLTNGSGGTVPVTGSSTIWVQIRVGQSKIDSTLGKNDTNSGHSADPINTATGNYLYENTDLSLPGRGLPFAFVRSYNSLDTTSGPLGVGWSHSYMASVHQNGDGSLFVRMPDGQAVTFDPSGGAFVPRDNNVRMKLSEVASGVYTVTTPGLMTFSLVAGQLTAIADRNGNTLQLTYTAGELSTITDTVGRQVAFAYDGFGRLISLTDPLGRAVTFGYDAANNLTSAVDARGGSHSYTYDVAHRMLTAVDPRGRTFLTNTYDAAGRVASQSDGEGNRWTYAYDGITSVTTITDPNGQVTSHRHDANFQLLQATDSFGKAEQYQYDAVGNRVSAQDRNGNTGTFAYDGNSNVTSVVQEQSTLQVTTYDSQNNVLSRKDALGNTTTFEYDVKGNLIRTTDPLGGTATATYDGSGQLLSKTDAEGRTTTYSYDERANLIRMTDASGKTTSYAYDAVGRRISMTDANGFITQTGYDANDNVVSVTDPLNNTTQHQYDGSGNRTKVIDPRGKATSYVYDGNNKLLTTTDHLAQTVTNTYDKLRNPASVTDQRNLTTHYAYNSENRLISSTDQLSKTTTYSYDASGNRTAVTDPLISTTRFSYDSLNRQVSITDALGAKTTTAYDAAGHIVAKTDPAGHVTQYDYDALGRQSAITDAAGGQVTFSYDKVGNRTEIQDARGNVTRFAYDSLDRVTSITDPLGNVTVNQYDAVGNLVQVTDGNGNSKTYQYDGNRRQKKVTYSTGGSVQITYDASGNRTQMVDLIGTSTYVYDDLNRLQSYTNPFGTGLAFTYDRTSHRTAIRYPGAKSVQYTYDAAGRVSTVTDWNATTTSYAYDAAGRLSNVSYSNGLASQYIYDAVGQNVSIRHLNGGAVLYSETTTWSANGNPSSSDILGLSSPAIPPENIAYTYNSAGQIASTTYGTAVHDKNGNLTLLPDAGGTTTFTYDLNNRATGIAGPSLTATMTYFGDGKLAQLNATGFPHRYLMDPTGSLNHVLAEIDTSGNMLIGYVYGATGMASQIIGSQTYAYLHNLQGSTVALVDPSGVIRNSYRYGPFGDKLPTSSEQITNSFTFLGSFSVPSGGQYSATTYRMYDSATGRFTSPDPADPQKGDYLYVNQSPIRLVDPTGLWAETLSKASQLVAETAGSAAEYAGYMKALKSLSNGVRLTHAEVVSLSRIKWGLPLVSIGLDAYRDYRDTGDAAVTTFNIGVNSAIAAATVAAGLPGAAFAIGASVGTLLSKVPVIGAGFVAIDTWVLESLLGPTGFQDWSSHENWIDYVDRPGGVPGYLLNRYIR